MSLRTNAPRRRRAVAAALVLVGGLALSGCAQIVDTFNSMQGIGGTTSAEQTVPTNVPTPAPSATMTFDSVFTYDGSLEMETQVADNLDLVLNVWAVEPKRTNEWTPTTEKSFGFAVNVYDRDVDDKAVLTEKRRVYISQLQIMSQTAQTSGQVQSPYQFSTDPRTLVPSDTLRSDRGLLLNSFQGGLLVPEQTIHQLPADTYGLTLEFALTIAVEGSADGNSFQQQTVYQYLPVAIFAG